MVLSLEKTHQDDEIQPRVLATTPPEIAAAHHPNARDTTECCSCCVICLEAVSDPCEAVPCGHADFDYHCATSWLFTRPCCPLCKAVVTGILHGAPGVADRPVTELPTTTTTTTTATGLVDQVVVEEEEEEGEEYYVMPSRSSARQPRYRPRSTAALQVRRAVYARARFSMHVGSNRLSRYRELTPHMFCADQHLMSRARNFIRRELQVFSFLSSAPAEPNTLQPPSLSSSSSSSSSTLAAPTSRRVNKAEFLLEYIVAILKSVDVMGSVGTARDMLADFLGGDHARLFLHELRAWLRSPFERLEDWDRVVQYGTSPTERGRQQQQQQWRRRRRRLKSRGDYERETRMGP